MSARRFLSVILCLLLIPSLTLISAAHPGKTDQNGGHTDHETGKYHYHHGYSAHTHTDMDGDGIIDCPYEFNDNTGQNSGSSSQTTHTNTPTQPKPSTPSQSSTISTDSKSKPPWWKTPINEDSFMLSFFVYGVPSLLLAIAFYFLISLCERRGFNRISKILYILVIALGVVALPCAIIVFSVAFALAGLLSLFIVPLHSLVTSIKKRFSNSCNQNSNHISVLSGIADQPSSPSYDGPILSPHLPPQSYSPSHNSPAHKVCFMIWSETSLFSNSLAAPMNVAQFMRMWSIYFLVVARSVNNQNFVNEVYSHFDLYATRHIAKLSEHTSVSEMKSEYRKMRPLLNPIQIDLTNSIGKHCLWNLVVKEVFSGAELSESTEDLFYTGVQVLSHFSKHLHNADSSHIKYSIDDFMSSNVLPDE